MFKTRLSIFALALVAMQVHANATIIAATASIAASNASIAASNAAMSASHHAQAAAVDYSKVDLGALTPVHHGRQFGFLTCGHDSTHAGSLACTDTYVKGHPQIPYAAWPGYRLGAAIPANYEVTGVSYNPYDDVATIYFEYEVK